MAQFFQRSSFCVVTGASRGLGREMALQLSQEWSQQGVESDLVLLARTEKDLQQTKSDIITRCSGISVHTVPVDLQDLATLPHIFSECVKSADANKHKQFVIIHNAGNPGVITKPFSEQNDPLIIHEQVALNFTSMSALTSQFLSKFTSGERYVVNISTLLAKVYFPGFAIYSSTRAARNALIGVLATEYPNVRFLTYSPGPCITDMFNGVCDTSFSQTVREMFQGQRERGEVLTCQQSIAKLVGLLRSNSYENAAVIDYYDV